MKPKKQAVDKRKNETVIQTLKRKLDSANKRKAKKNVKKQTK
jgi:hypothetical protein